MSGSSATLLPATVGVGDGGGGRMRDLRRDSAAPSVPRRRNVQRNQAMKNAAEVRDGLVAEAQRMWAGHDTGEDCHSPRLHGWTAAIVSAAAEPASPSLPREPVATPVGRYNPIVTNPCWRSGEYRRKNMVTVDSNT